MNASEQTFQQIERALRKVSDKLSNFYEHPPFSDLHLQVTQEGGELLIFNDEDEELTRCVIEEWIGNTDESFYKNAEEVLKQSIGKLKDVVEHLNLLRPYSLVMIDEDKETIAELLYVDDETIVLDGDLMEGLSDDLDAFWEELAKR